MKKPNVMRGGESGANLSRELQRFVLWQTADTTQQRREFFALNKFHRKEVPSLDLADVVNTTDILVRDLAGNAHLAMKPRQRPAVAEQMIRQKLQRDRLRKFQIVRAIDFAHSAFAQQADDAITIREDRSGHKARVVNRVEGGERSLIAEGARRWRV
jgi:vacuolar-type H+-ATPase subunit I/STV1